MIISTASTINHILTVRGEPVEPRSIKIAWVLRHPHGLNSGACAIKYFAVECRKNLNNLGGGREVMIEGKYINVMGINTYYLSGGNGSPVILIHGVGAGVFDWKFTVGPLSEHHRVYALDMVGYGHSDKPKTNYTLDYYVDFLEHFMDALQLDRASLVGQCFGGGTALGLATKSPKRIEKLILVNSASLGKEIQGGWVNSLPFFLVQLFSRPSRKTVRLGFKWSVYNSGFITNQMVEESYQLRNIPGATYARASTYKTNFGVGGQRHYFLDNLPQITVPTLIIWGREDKYFPIAHAQNAHRLIKNSQLNILEKCGHIPQLEKPDEFNRVVLDFLK
jgi:pimeloyl-ACP methyl ester carboxylesterase